MIDSSDSTEINKFKEYQSPQCQYFVVRKKRLCRMTVRPGRQYCGEHEPKPKTENGQDDTRIPCPNDVKHTCYASKLEKHLKICNARQEELPPYVVLNINSPEDDEPPLQVSLSNISDQKMVLLIDKINKLYDTYLKDKIEIFEDQEIHETILTTFQEKGRGEKSLRHLRQTASLLRLAEREQLVRPHTCYVELGAGKGHLSYYAWQAWCAEPARDSRVLLVDRASLRHKRDNKLRTEHAHAQDVESSVIRVRADLAHLRLERAPGVGCSQRVVGLAKHLCGVATDYALRSLTSGGLGARGRGLVLAPCCHHRCRRRALLGRAHLQELGITDEELELMLRMVSWATCGDGRSRERRRRDQLSDQVDEQPDDQSEHRSIDSDGSVEPSPEHRHEGDSSPTSEESGWAWAGRARVGRRCKALVEWARVLALRRRGLRARLVRFVPASVSPENLCIVASSPDAAGAGCSHAHRQL